MSKRTHERRKMSDENLVWFTSQVLPSLCSEVRDPIIQRMDARDRADSERERKRAEEMKAVKAAIKSHTLQCFLVAAVTAVFFSGVVYAYWR